MELEGEECYSFYKKGDRAAASIFTSTDHNPWVMGAGYSTVVSVESNEIKGVLKDAVREDAKNIVVTGNIQHDNVYKLNKLPLCEDRTKSVLVALPQFYEHGMCSWEYQQKFVSDLVQVLDPMFDQIDISLHPSMLRNDYEFLESDRIVILDENFSKIVNYYKVIVCTFSSVVVWSRLLGKFVVVVDPLNLAYSQRYFPYNLYCRQSSELNALSKITFDEKSEYLNLIRGNYKFDGNALKRTVQLIQEYR